MSEQTSIASKNENQRDSQTSEITIGKVKYIVTTHFNPEGRETAEDKLFRLVAERVVNEFKTDKLTISELT